MSALTLMAGEGPTGWADAAEGSANPEAARDIELVERAQAGDDLAFGELVDRHRRSVFRAAFAALRSAAESDDVAQETFVAASWRISVAAGAGG